MNVQSIMTTQVVTVSLDDSLAVVKNIFDNVAFHHLLVVEDGALFGVISDRDLFKEISPNIGKASESADDLATLNKKVHQVMTRKPVVVHPDTTVKQAVSLFHESGVSCMPVVDENNIPVGILSWRDIFRAISSGAE